VKARDFAAAAEAEVGAGIVGGEEEEGEEDGGTKVGDYYFKSEILKL